MSAKYPIAFSYQRFRALLKRSLDLSVSLLLLVLLSPVFLLIALSIKLSSPGPVLFKQTRVSRFYRRFTCYKFRSMRVDTKPYVCAGPEIKKGITRVGGFLRRYKLDELPQLINVLRGEMSLVGPRPMIARYVDMFPEEYKKILTIKPGLTGLASIKMYAKEEAMLDKAKGEDVYIEKILPPKLRLNQFYLKNMSNRFDMLIIYWTAKHLAKLCWPVNKSKSIDLSKDKEVEYES